MCGFARAGKEYEMTQIERLIASARAEVGTTELPAGSNNVKYNTSYYGRAVSGVNYPWCMAFIWWCFDAAGLGALIPKTASCVTLLQHAKDTRRLVEPRELRPGDVVLYKFATNERAANHAGLVTSVAAKAIVAIEGNTSLTSDDNGGAVMPRTRDFTHIVGGFRPNYEEGTTVSYEEFVALMRRYEAETAALSAQYGGAAGAEFAAARAAGITDGSRPRSAATREECAIMAARAAARQA